MTMHLVLSAFASSQFSLLASNKASLFSIVCALPPNILTSSS